MSRKSGRFSSSSLADRFCILAALVTFTATVQAEHHVECDNKCLSDNPGSHALWITGQIAASDVDGVQRYFTDLPAPHLIGLNSGGGDVDAAMRIGRILRAQEATVIIPQGGMCLSSCALIYIGATTRQNFGELGLHRPYLAGMPRSEAEIVSAVEAMLTHVRAYVAEMGITSEFAEIMINTPPESMRVYNYRTVEQLVPKEDPLTQELRVAFAARQYGLTTEEFRRRESEAYAECFVPEVNQDDWFACHESVLWGLSKSVYKRRIKEVQQKCPRGLLSDTEYEAWIAAGHDWWTHPYYEWQQSCDVSVMAGQSPPPMPSW